MYVRAECVLEKSALWAACLAGTGESERQVVGKGRRACVEPPLVWKAREDKIVQHFYRGLLYRTARRTDGPAPPPVSELDDITPNTLHG